MHKLDENCNAAGNHGLTVKTPRTSNASLLKGLQGYNQPQNPGPSTCSYQPLIRFLLIDSIDKKMKPMNYAVGRKPSRKTPEPRDWERLGVVLKILMIEY